ncbi:hypothetical protein C1H46_030740 [Malus baccata]|uniref:Uncharacterized protein n=1 Tax=Malus baccata TaxID=106549 RepID=A0A540LB83_MALBA|nr:hypothetical protein C1H46_030740 [Malus baccata]
MGYAVGTQAPGRCSSWQNRNCTGGDSTIEPSLVTHHILLAHGAAVELYKNRYQASHNGLIWITLVSHWFEPASEPKQIKMLLYYLWILCLDDKCLIKLYINPITCLLTTCNIDTI